jgi:chromosome segregation ATPase
VAQLAASQKALSGEKSAQSSTLKSLAEERDARQTAEQALKNSVEAKAKLAQALETTKAAYTITWDNLASISRIVEKAEEKLANIEKKLATTKEEKENQELLLKMAQQAVSKREDSSTLMISTAVANAMALLKSHMPDLDVKLLRMDFAVDEVEREALTNSAYDAAHEFASSYDFSSLAESEDNDSPSNM